MQLDALAVVAMTAVVVYTAGVFFLIDMMIRRQEVAGRVWALSFLAAMLASAAYLDWVLGGAIWSAATGNGAMVAAAGFLWAGCRSFNRRPALVSAGLSALASGCVYLVTQLRADEGEWAGAVPMFLLIAVFLAAAAVETLRGAIRRRRAATGLTVVLGAVSAFYLARTAVFVAAGPDSAVFADWFGTTTASMATVVLVVVALLTTTVLRAEHPGAHGAIDTTALRRGEDGLLDGDSLLLVMHELSTRTTENGEELAVAVLSVRNLDQIARAFGADAMHGAKASIRSAVRGAAPSTALVGDGEADEIVVVFVPASEDDAHAAVRAVRDAVDAGLRGDGVVVAPPFAVGIAVAPATRASTLLDSARRAATNAEDGRLVVATIDRSGQDQVDL